MTARMEIIIISRREFHAAEIVRHCLPGEGPQAVLFRAGVQSIGGMRDEAHDFIFFRECEKRVYILRVDFLRFAAARIAREKREYVRVQFFCFLSHCDIPARRRKMITDMQ